MAQGGEEIPTFRIVLLGDGAVGKTTFVRRYQQGDFLEEYNPTVQFEVVPMDFTTSLGPIRFQVVDTAGQERTGNLRAPQYANAQGCIILFDVTSMVTYRNVKAWEQDIKKVCPGIQTVVCGNKVDVRDRDRKVKAKHLRSLPTGLQYYDVSAKSNFNYEMPFLYLARRLLNDDTLEFIQGPALIPPEIELNEEQLARLQRDMMELENAAGLPDEEEDF